jgi:hypothetical protein
MGQFALSASGMLLYAAGDRYPTLTSTLVRVDRKGAETALAEIKANLGGLRLSPSGTRVVAYKTGDGSRAIDVWTYDLPSGTPTRLTSTGDASWLLLSPDGPSVMFRRSELFFLVRPVPERPDVAMMSVEISADGDFKASARDGAILKVCEPTSGSTGGAWHCTAPWPPSWRHSRSCWTWPGRISNVGSA